MHYTAIMLKSIKHFDTSYFVKKKKIQFLSYMLHLFSLEHPGDDILNRKNGILWGKDKILEEFI